MCRLVRDTEIIRNTFIRISRTARPMVAFARLPGPNRFTSEFIPSSSAIGPLTTSSGAEPPACSGTMEVEIRFVHRFEGRHNHGEELGFASCHNRIDGGRVHGVQIRSLDEMR